ncbi:hypothetical protein THIX_60476 [Thiomonas sp. X19]|nr:hypothetical protein THIX_60476 [Thiomonas sp. X19]
MVSEFVVFGQVYTVQDGNSQRFEITPCVAYC